MAIDGPVRVQSAASGHAAGLILLHSSPGPGWAGFSSARDLPILLQYSVCALRLMLGVPMEAGQGSRFI
jgi:hypothetical protein